MFYYILGANVGSLLHGDVSVKAGAISDDLALITSSRSELCKEVKLISQVSRIHLASNFNFQDNCCPEQ